MRYKDFIELYWKQYLMIEKELYSARMFVSFTKDNYDSYSDFFAKIILQIGSEVDVVAKLLCKEINSESTADSIGDYRNEILGEYPEFESIRIQCFDMDFTPWEAWSENKPCWWDIYNGIKHNRFKEETHDGITKENYKFANLKNTLISMAGLYLVELYLFKNVSDKENELGTPLPGSRLFNAISGEWENISNHPDSCFFIKNGCLYINQSDFLYSDL